MFDRCLKIQRHAQLEAQRSDPTPQQCSLPLGPQPPWVSLRVRGFKRVGGAQGPRGQSPASQGRMDDGGAGPQEAVGAQALMRPAQTLPAQLPRPPALRRQSLRSQRRGDEWSSLRAWPWRAAGRGQEWPFLNLKAWSRPCLGWAGNGGTPGSWGRPQSNMGGRGVPGGPHPGWRQGVSRTQTPASLSEPGGHILPRRGRGGGRSHRPPLNLRRIHPPASAGRVPLGAPPPQ